MFADGEPAEAAGEPAVTVERQPSRQRRRPACGRSTESTGQQRVQVSREYRSAESTGQQRVHMPRNLRGGALDFRALRNAYFAHVRSILEYGSVIWAGAAVTHMKRLERVQHTFLIWLASRSNHPTNNFAYEHLLTHFQIPSIKSRLHQHDLLFLFKIFHGQIDCPELVKHFSLSAPSRRTRDNKLWHIPFARVNTILNTRCLSGFLPPATLF